jgi:hypothetical protein
MVEEGLLIYDEDSGDNGEWIVPLKYLTIKLKSDLSFSIPLYYDIIKQSYFIPDNSSTSLRIQIVTQLNKVYGIVNPTEMFYIIDNFIESLPQRLKELGL